MNRSSSLLFPARGVLAWIRGAAWRLAAAAAAAVVATGFWVAQAQDITLILGQPEYAGCGHVSINGVVLDDSGVILRLEWDWGDGTVETSWFPAQHAYRTNGTYAVQVTAFDSNGQSKTATVTATIADADTPACGNTIRVYPSVVMLKNGKTRETLRVDVRNAHGVPVEAPAAAVTFTSSNSELVQVNNTGEVSAAGLGRATVEVRIAGQVRFATVPVYAGEMRLVPALLALSPSGPATGQVHVEAFNADGSAAELGGRTVTFRGGNAVASVDENGIVTALRVPAEFGESPYILADVDGEPVLNASFIRVTGADLGLHWLDYPGQRIAYRMAQEVGSLPYAWLMDHLDVVEVTEAVFQLEEWLTGYSPDRLGRQFLVLDAGIDADGTVPCGLSGNPLRLGVGVDNLRSCFGGADWVQWGVIAHELGHDFLAHAALGQLWIGLEGSMAFSEGLATACGAYALDQLASHPERYGLRAETVASLHGLWLPLSPDNVRFIHYQALNNYETSPDFAADFDANVLDATLMKLGDEYGTNFLRRLLSVFCPADERLPVGFANDAQRLTFWVAACSAAAGADLKDRFSMRWAFPVDDAFYQAVLPEVCRRANQRDPFEPPVIREAQSAGGELILRWAAVPGMPYAIERSSDCGSWSEVAGATPGGFAAEWREAAGPGPATAFYRLRVGP